LPDGIGVLDAFLQLNLGNVLKRLIEQGRNAEEDLRGVLQHWEFRDVVLPMKRIGGRWFMNTPNLEILHVG
jgi:hypothetical protein